MDRSPSLHPFSSGIYNMVATFEIVVLLSRRLTMIGGKKRDLTL